MQWNLEPSWTEVEAESDGFRHYLQLFGLVHTVNLRGHQHFPEWREVCHRWSHALCKLRLCSNASLWRSWSIMKQSSQGSQGTKFWNSSKKRPAWITSQHAACLPSKRSIVHALTCQYLARLWCLEQALQRRHALKHYTVPQSPCSGDRKQENQSSNAHWRCACLWIRVKSWKKAIALSQSWKSKKGEKIVEHGWTHRNIISSFFRALSSGIMPFLITIPDKMLVAIYCILFNV